MEKVLPVKKPPITSYMTHAPILSIISDDDKYLPWFFLNFIQMSVYDAGIDFYHFYTAHYSCPFFDTTYISRQFLPAYIKANGICDFFSHCIDGDYYIIAIIDTSFVQLYSNAKRGDVHPILIHGYDEDNKIFYVADFFNRGVFSFKNTSFDELELAYENCDEAYSWIKGIHLLKRIEFTKKYSIVYFIDSIKKYLYGNEPSIGYSHIPDENILFGLNASYDRLLDEVEKFKAFQAYDERLFPVFCEHKIILRMMGEFLAKNGCEKMNELRQDYISLCRKAFILRNRWIKCSLQKTNDLYDEKDLLALKDSEVSLLKRTINILENMNDDVYF